MLAWRGVKHDGESAGDSPRAIGARVLRKEDRRLLTGRGTYVDDVAPPRTAHACFVRSTEAHAELLEIDAERARDVPGVIAVLTAADLEGRARPIRALNSTPGYQECDTPILATRKVRMVGEPVALVLAESRYAAEDGAGAVQVSYRPCGPWSRSRTRWRRGRPRSTTRFPTTSSTASRPRPTDWKSLRRGRRGGRARAAPAALRRGPDGGTRGHRRPGRRLRPGRSGSRARSPTSPARASRSSSSMPETAIRVISPDVGGGFGPKCVLYQEEVAVCAAARAARPAGQVGRGPRRGPAHHRARTRADPPGQGSAHRRGTGPGRGRGDPVVERRLRPLAVHRRARFGPGVRERDRALRHPGVQAPRQGGGHEQVPDGPLSRGGTGHRLPHHGAADGRGGVAPGAGSPGDPAAQPGRASSRTRPRPGWCSRAGTTCGRSRCWPRRSGGTTRRAGTTAGAGPSGRLRGVGVACAVEHSAYGPKSLGSRNHELTLGYDTASLRVEPDGKLRLAVGLHSHGQGQETTMAQIVADELGVDPSDVDVVFGDTAVVPYGNGTWASRSTVYCGGAAILAARDIREKTMEVAADMLEANPGDLDLAGGMVTVRGTPGRGVSLAEVAQAPRPRASPAPRGDGAGPGVHAPLLRARPRELLQRHARRRRGGRSRDGRRRRPPLRGGRGLRHR